MRCKKCIGKLEILRTCGKVQMRCRNCNKEYQIHEVADQLNPETEEILESYTAIIYDQLATVGTFLLQEFSEGLYQQSLTIPYPDNKI